VQQELNLTEVGRHISFTEQRAEDAEEELKTVLMLQMLSNHIGDELDCVVTGLTNFGVFVQSRKFGIEGLITTAELGADEWKYNQKSQCVVGQRSGCSIHLGRAIKVRIVSVNVPARQLNVCPAEPLVKPVERKRKRKDYERPQRSRMQKRSKRKR